MKIRLLISTGLLLLLVQNIWADTSLITSKNWLNHPAIKEVRLLYSEVRAKIDKKRLKKQQRNFDFCKPYEDSMRIIYLNSKGVVRNYYYDAGSGDSMVRWDFYYDKNGMIRFAFIRANATNGTQIEHRIYFNDNGKRIWEIQKYLKGPGYTFPHVPWPNSNIVFEPKKTFVSKNVCKEK